MNNLVGTLTARIRRAIRAFREDPESTSRHRVTFHITLQRDPLDGGFVAECPELPGCVSQGDTEAEALENILDAMSEVLDVQFSRARPALAEASGSADLRSIAVTV